MPLTVTNNSAFPIRHLEWGEESRFYNAATSLILDSDSLVTTGFAGTGTTRTGAYDPGAAGNNVIRATLASQPAAVCGTGVQSHVGTFRVKARVWAAAATTGTVQVRLSWQDSAGPMRSNPWATPPVVNNWAEIDLGVITIEEAQAGTQRWTGRVEAYSSVIGETVDVDMLMLIPAERYGVAWATYSYSPGVLLARDEFTGMTAGANLNARSAPLGGTWAVTGTITQVVAADAPGTDESIQVSTSADTGDGRYALLGSGSYTDIEVGMRVRIPNSFGPISPIQRVNARYVDFSNHLRLSLHWNAPNWTGSFLALEKRIAGGNTTLATKQVSTSENTWYRLRMVVFSSGRALGQLLTNDGALLATVDASDSALATGGTLQTGGVGFGDFNSGTAFTRYYDEFYTATPPAEPVVIYPGQSIQIGSTSCKREDATGTYYGDPPSYVGSRCYVPCAGTRGRKTRLVVKARRNDIETMADDQIGDSMTVSCSIVPRYIAVPR
jgi:hypothetical protein